MMIGIRRRNPLIHGIVPFQGLFRFMEFNRVFWLFEFVLRVPISLVFVSRDLEYMLSGGVGEISRRNSRHAVNRHRF